MSDAPLTILKREDGPTPGYTNVTVATGASGTAMVVIYSRLIGTQMELDAIRQALKSRADRQAAASGEPT